MPEPLHLGAVILAAGASRRMGTPKQLLSVGGQSLVRHVTDAVLASPAWPVVLVVGAHAEAVRREVIRLPVLVVDHRGWEEGLASSIRAGMAVIESFSLALEAALLVLGDQPALSPGAIHRLAAAHRRSGRSIVAARYGGHPGPPVLFARNHLPELLALQGPGGARPLLVRHAAQVATVDLPELAADLDTPDDYRRYLRDQSTPTRHQP